MPVSTMMPDVVVEIAFTTGPNSPTPVWEDVSAYVEGEVDIQITKGRADEESSVPPARLILTLDNTTGRFTPENVAGAYYPNVKKGRKIRVSMIWPLSGSPVTYRRFTGYIDEWPVSWPDETGYRSLVTITASSRMARMGRGVELRSIVEEEYLQDNPTAYYPLGEPEGSTTAGNRSTTSQPAISVTQAGTGGSLTFGAGTGPGTDGMSAPLWVRGSPLGDGKYLATAGLQGVPGTSGYIMLEAFVASTLADAQTVLTVAPNGGILTAKIELGLFGSGEAVLSYTKNSSGNNIIGTTNVLDGAVHHLVGIAYANGSLELYVDGVLEDSSGAFPSLSPLFSATQFFIGGYAYGFAFAMHGSVAHAAVYAGATPMSAARILAHSNSGRTGFSGERSDQRIARLAGYAGVPSVELALETGASVSVVNQETTDQTPLTLMSDVVATEGGVLFDAGDGSLTFHARTHRYNVASNLTVSAASQEIEADLEPKLDDQGLVNDMTADRPGGIVARAVDLTSIDDYGIYRDSITLLTTLDTEVQDAVDWKVFTASQPQVRIPTCSIDVLNCSSAQKALLLDCEIGDRITLSGLPSQAPATVMDFFVEGWTEIIGAERLVITFNLSPAVLSGVWQLDSPTYSQLGTTTRLAY